ncbi:flavin-containing monooxygenase [Leucobacter chinensis]|uniref:flavin-containing monooxygenase n=1 Tax=Leucobacter chinensis TaxID=2851010 RepID=UPI001C232435|nr:NAD(P)/FAD-dependent oxidoreductase [Leucobacter chinensis]
MTTETHTTEQAGAQQLDETAEILIIGAGFAGLGMGAQLRRAGREDFLIIERAGEVGGTWRDNTYPGAACDVPSHLYSFSFAMNPDWSGFYTPGPEIQNYLLNVTEQEGLRPHLRLNANMDEAKWDEQAERWIVRTPRGTYTGRYLITGTGHLADPSLPDIPGLADFAGDIFHSARWNHDVDLTGKRVAVVGTGASAIQVVPEMAEIASELTVFQRTPAWVIPRIVKPYSAATRRKFARDYESMQRERDDIFWFAESAYAQRRAVPAALAEVTANALGNLERAVPDPELRAKLTPSYMPGCKRVLSSNAYYPTFNRDNVTLEASALTRVEGNTAYGADGVGYEVDAIVLCTGFEAAQPPFAEAIFDGEGVSLADHWSTGMSAFDSTAVSGFPNLFAINGPNTSLGHNSIVYIIESQVQYILEALDRADAEGLRTLVPARPAEEEYVAKIQERAATSVWLMDGGCNSWYVDPRSGNLTLIWPDYAYDFRARNGHFTGAGFLSRGADGTVRPLAEQQPKAEATLI